MTIDFKEIIKEVKANQARLESCAGPHQFVIHTTIPGTPLGKTYRCERCQGTVDHHAHYWYQLGLKHSNNAIPPDKSDLSSEAKPG